MRELASIWPGWSQFTYDIIMVIGVGGVFAWWLSNVVNRQAGFRQIKVNALQEIADLKRETLEADIDVILVRIHWILEAQIIAFGADEQWDAMRSLAEVRNNLRSKLRAVMDEKISPLKARSPQVLRVDVIAAQDEVYRACSADIRNALKDIEALKPDNLRILGLIPANKTLDRWESCPIRKFLVPFFDLLRTRKIRISRFRDYLDGKSEDPW